MAPDTPTGSPPKACRSHSYSCSFTSASVVPWPIAASIISPIRLTGPTVNSRSPTIRPTRPFSKSLTYLPQRDVTSSNVEVFLFTIFDLRIYICGSKCRLRSRWQYFEVDRTVFDAPLHEWRSCRTHPGFACTSSPARHLLEKLQSRDQ